MHDAKLSTGSTHSSLPICLSTATPKHRLPNPALNMWTKTHEANLPSEDRHSSIVNLFLRPSQQSSLDSPITDAYGSTNNFHEQHALIRVSMWAVYDGHGGDGVSSYASQKLLPVAAVAIADALECKIDADTARWDVNGEIKDSSELSRYLSDLGCSFGCTQKKPFDAKRHNLSNCQYKTPAINSEKHVDNVGSETVGNICKSLSVVPSTAVKNNSSFEKSEKHHKSKKIEHEQNYSKVSSCLGQHSLQEQHKIRNALTKSFLSVDEEWINGIDCSVTQSCCVNGGSWNAGCCALLVCLVQRMECTCAQCTSLVEGVQNYGQDCDAMLYTAHTGDCRAVVGTTSTITENCFNSSDKNDLVERSTHLIRQKKREKAKKCEVNETKMNYLKKRKKYECNEMPNCKEKNRKNIRNNIIAPHIGGAPYTINRSMWLPHPKLSPSLVENDNSFTSDSCTFNYNNTSTSTTDEVLHIHDVLSGIDLTIDHSAEENDREADLVRERCNHAPRAIVCAKSDVGIKRVAGSLAVTRALGDAYLKSPLLSFAPYKQHAPYITARPEITTRRIKKNGRLHDKILVLASDGIWERATGNAVIELIQSYYYKSEVAVENEFKSKKNQLKQESKCSQNFHPIVKRSQRAEARFYRELVRLDPSDPSDLIVKSVLNSIRKSCNMSSISSLLQLPRGKARRSKHDDMTASVINLSAFVA